MIRAVGLTLGLMGIVAFALEMWLPAELWVGMPLGKGGQFAEYCELNRMDQLIRQPINSWSNFIYVFLGITAWQYHPQAKGQFGIISFPNYAKVIAISFFLLCLGSFFYHASLTEIGQRLDMTTTYGLVSSILAGLIYRLGEDKWWKNTPRNQGILVGFLILAYLLFYTFMWEIPDTLVLPLMMALVAILSLLIWLQKRNRVKVKWLILGIMLIGISGIFREMDLQKVACGPESWFQLHALWHVFTGLSGFASFLFLGTGKKM